MANEYESIGFHNGSDFDVELEWGGTSYGVCGPHQTVTVPRFVAEHWAMRNEKYQLAEDSERAQAIESGKRELRNLEDVGKHQADQEVEARRQAKKARAEQVKAEADIVLEEEEDMDDELDAEEPEPEAPKAPVDSKSPKSVK